MPILSYSKNRFIEFVPDRALTDFPRLVAAHPVGLVHVVVLLANVLSLLRDELDLVQDLLATLHRLKVGMVRGAANLPDKFFVLRVDLILLCVGSVPATLGLRKLTKKSIICRTLFQQNNYPFNGLLR